MRLDGASVVLTGAGSGIGRALAHALDARGARVAMIDRDAEGLDGTARAMGEGHSTHVLDVTDRDGVRTLSSEIGAAPGGVHCLVNNAGIAVGGTFETTRETDFDRCVDVNFQGVVNMTRAFLPLLRASVGGHEGRAPSRPVRRIVNVSSIFGLIGPPGQTAYSASKFAVAGFSQALRADLYGSGIGVSVVHPGGVATQIARSALVPPGTDPEEIERRLERSDRLLVMPPARAARIMLRGIERGRDRIVVGRDAIAGDALVRLMPVRYANVIRRLGVEF